MTAKLVSEMNRLGLSEKVSPEFGDGDSATNNRAVELNPQDGLVNVGSDHHLHDEHYYEALELFKTTVSKKKNIYSTDPVPLNSPWTFWVDRTERGINIQQYEANLKRIYTVYTVHRFWGVYYNIPKPSDLQCRSSLHMMRDERKPVWEEPYNCKGGTFRLRVQKKDTDKVWKEMLMAAIGEQLNEYVAENDEVCGVSVSTREREDVVLVWNANAKAASQAKVFDCVRLLLPDTNFLSTFYKPHETHHAFEKPRRGIIEKERLVQPNQPHY